MEHDGKALDGDREFIDWLKRNKLIPYQQPLEDEGFEDVESLTILSSEEIEELSTAVQMKITADVKIDSIITGSHWLNQPLSWLAIENPDKSFIEWYQNHTVRDALKTRLEVSMSSEIIG